MACLYLPQVPLKEKGRRQVCRWVSLYQEALIFPIPRTLPLLPEVRTGVIFP